jgi:hypothetical protein
MITFSDPRTPSIPLFQRLDILNILEIVKRQLCEIAYKHSNRQLPDIFVNYFKEINVFIIMTHAQKRIEVYIYYIYYIIFYSQRDIAHRIEATRAPPGFKMVDHSRVGRRGGETALLVR